MNEVEQINVVLLLLSVSSILVTIDGLSVARRPQQIRQLTIQVNGYRPTIVSVLFCLPLEVKDKKIRTKYM